ncbi:MAG: hypothetical protein O7H41_14770 [Planctomycetota bacterium]|nr:hypothetical protein [Planctomycetota bacterium]
MKSKSSFVIGLLAGAALIFTVAAAAQPSPDLGRYQIVDPEASLPFMLDTATGETWHLVQPSRAKYQSDDKKLRLPAWYPMKKHDMLPK